MIAGGFVDSGDLADIIGAVRGARPVSQSAEQVV
jgi:hypothetical protein